MKKKHMNRKQVAIIAAIMVVASGILLSLMTPPTDNAPKYILTMYDITRDILFILLGFSVGTICSILTNIVKKRKKGGSDNVTD